MLRRFLRRFGILIAIVGSLHFYVADRALSGSFLPGVAVAGGWTFFSLAFASLIAGTLAMIFPRGGLTRYARTLGHFWLGAFFILFSLTVATDLIRLVATPFWPERHWLDWQSAILLGIGPVMIALAFINGTRDPKVARRKVMIEGLGEGLRGFRIVQLSDLHVGHPGTDRAFLERLVKRIDELQPDAIAITGDAVEGSPQALREMVAPLAKLRAPHGVYYVTGNHEYYHDGPAWEAAFRELGFTVLDNEHRVVERGGSKLVVGGIPDATATYFDPRRQSSVEHAFAGSPPAPRILLAHQPRAVRQAAAVGVQLQLSGHTHGGQIFPFNFLVRLQQPTSSGLKKLGKVWVYTHPGTGYWGPRMRLGTSAEIAEVTLL